MKTTDNANCALANELAELPAEARREVFDFIVFLRQRDRHATKKPKQPASSLRDEPFLGIWADRADMRDSFAWVRETRRREWG